MDSHQPMLHALTIDVEDYYHVAAFKDVIDRDRWADYDSRVEQNTDRLLALTAEKGVQATFFVLGWVAERYPQLVRRIADQGHEVGSHGYSHQLIYQQAPATFEQETLRSKALLEDIIGAPVLGYRAASYSITPRSLWALDTIAEAGFEYDSSIYPVLHDNYGLQGGPTVPYRIDLRNGASLVEFPITTVNVLGYDLPVGGGGYFRIYPFALTRRLLQMRVRQQDQPFVFYLHPWEVDPEQPRVPGAGRLSRFRHYHNLSRVEGRFGQLMDEFEFATMRRVLGQTSNLPHHAYT